jgi:hypothetical protein
MRLTLALLTILGTALHSTESEACWLSDCLCGRNTAPYAVSYAPYGYTVAYAPVAATPYAAGYAPVAATQYAAGYAPVAATPYAAGYAAVPVTGPAVAPRSAWNTAPSVWNTAPAVANGAYQAQRPSYYNNPSVYTGQPVTGNVQTSYRVPIANTLRGTRPTRVYLGAGNRYPDIYRSAYVSAYPNTASPGEPIVTATPTGAPATAIPATQVAPMPTTAVAPVYAAPPPPPRCGCGLSRFFGSYSRTNYRTSYYRAPVTYYRPVTTVDPVSGMAVAVQQPCTAYEQQLQRTPYNSLQLPPGQPPQPTSSCPAPSNCPPCSCPVQPAPYGAAPPSGIGQVGGVSPIGQPPIRSPAAGGYYLQPGSAPNLAPMTGAPPTLAPPVGDQAPVNQPQMQNGAPPQSIDARRESTEPAESTDADNSAEPTGSSAAPPRSYWQLQGAEDSTAMIRPSAPRPIEYVSDPLVANAPGAAPLQAPSGYVAPFPKPANEAPATAVPQPQTDFDAPPLPARAYDPSEVTSIPNRTDIQVREAALVRARSYRPAPTYRPAPKPVKRDSSWYTIQP